MGKHWQHEHERLLAEMQLLIGARSHNNSDLAEALAKVTDPVTLEIYERLNNLNTEAYEKAERER